jgi:tRNA1Val (adenine37-N6)-methyltransferase
MGGSYFRFKKFTLNQSRSSFKAGTDGVLLGAYADVTGVKKVLDIGTGTGLIALMLAQRSDAEITGLETDINSFLEACENVRNSDWHSRVKIENRRLQDYYPETADFDLIVTNPPYFVNALKNPDPLKSSARHNISLDHSDILEGAGRLLKKTGRLQIILPYTEGSVFIAEATEYGFYCNDILKIKPLPSSKAKRMILEFSRERKVVTEKFLTIEKGNRHNYTEEYIKLTGDFYLNF